MDKTEALNLLGRYLDEGPATREEYRLWCYRVEDVLKAAFGKDSDEYQRFDSTFWGLIESWDKMLPRHKVALESILQKYQTLGIPPPPLPTGHEVSPKAFIAHGGKSASLNKLCSFLEALGVEPLVVEVEPSEGRLTEEQVDKYMKKADCAIILATYGHIEDVKTRKKHPRLNVVDELGRYRKVFPDRTILLLEKGVNLPSNVSGIVYQHFTKQNMEKAFIKVAAELRAFGLITPAEPAGQYVSIREISGDGKELK